MRWQFYPKHSEEFLKDIKIINKYGGFTEDEWLKGFYLKTSSFVKRKKTLVMKYIDGDWLLGRITDSEYRELTGKEVSKALKQERFTMLQNSELYKENSRKALMMGISN